MKHKFGTLLMLLGSALILSALALFLYNQREAAQAEESAAVLLPRLVEEVSRIEETQPLQPEIPAQLLTPEQEKMPETVIEGNSYIGYLSLPTLDLELPIMSDWSMENLRIAPCRYYGSLRGNDLVLLAHNYDRHFGRLGKLNEGDQVLFTDMNGVTTEYEVIAQDILDPYAVEEMTSGEFDLTLFTCTYGGKSRVTVYCDRVK